MINIYNQERLKKEAFDKNENEAFQILCDYLHFLERKYEEKRENFISIDDFFDNKYASKYLQEKEKINYYLDIFIYGTNNDKRWFLDTNGKVVKEYGRIVE